MRKLKPTEAEVNPFDGTVKTVPAVPRREHLFGAVETAELEGSQTMKIKLTVDWTGCADGIHPITHAAGTEQDFPEAVAAGLLKDGRAVLVNVETKALSGAPENKMKKGPKLNKAKRK